MLVELWLDWPPITLALTLCEPFSRAWPSASKTHSHCLARCASQCERFGWEAGERARGCGVRYRPMYMARKSRFFRRKKAQHMEPRCWPEWGHVFGIQWKKPVTQL